MVKDARGTGTNAYLNVSTKRLREGIRVTNSESYVAQSLHFTVLVLISDPFPLPMYTSLIQNSETLKNINFYPDS